MQGIPSIMMGRDVILLAQTGTGKTITFLLPLLTKLMNIYPTKGGNPYALILAPTRELVEQLLNDASQFLNPNGGIDPEFPVILNDPISVSSLDPNHLAVDGIFTENGKLRHNIVGVCGGVPVEHNVLIFLLYRKNYVEWELIYLYQHLVDY